MSTGENINANGANLNQEMIRMGFHKFPQSEIALVSPNIWPQVAGIMIAEGYPFQAQESALVPSGEVWFVRLDTGAQLGRIVGLGTIETPQAESKETAPQVDPNNTRKRVKNKLL